MSKLIIGFIFLSTLSLRRATGRIVHAFLCMFISIHALLAESDPGSYIGPEMENAFLSTLSLRRATLTTTMRCDTLQIFLSTLSLRRATLRPKNGKKRHNNFYPRSPCGERPLLSFARISTSQNFYPRSPCGERPFVCGSMQPYRIFLSTLSLRRATLIQGKTGRFLVISIHALLAESDRRQRDAVAQAAYFYPRSPCGERPTPVLMPT